MTTRLPDPTTSPSGPGFATDSLSNMTPTQSHDLNNASTVAISSGLAFWGIKITYNDLYYDADDTQELLRFIRSREGSFNPVTIVLPEYAEPRNGSFSHGSVVVGSGQDGNTLVITNWNSISAGDKANALQPNDVIKLSNSSLKVYQINEVDYTSGGSGGELTLTLHTYLAATTTGSDDLVTVDVDFHTRIKRGTSPARSMNSAGMYGGLTLDLKESLI